MTLMEEAATTTYHEKLRVFASAWPEAVLSNPYLALLCVADWNRWASITATAKSMRAQIRLTQCGHGGLADWRFVDAKSTEAADRSGAERDTPGWWLARTGDGGHCGTDGRARMVNDDELRRVVWAMLDEQIRERWGEFPTCRAEGCQALAVGREANRGARCLEHMANPAYAEPLPITRSMLAMHDAWRKWKR